MRALLVVGGVGLAGAALAQTSPPATTADVQAVVAAVESVRVLALSLAVCLMFALGFASGSAS